MERPEREERINTWTHGIATLLAMAAAFWLIQTAWRHGPTDLFIACTVYSITLVAVFLCSTLSHWETDPRRRAVYRQLDQGFIYLLIIGTMTPFILAYFPGRWSNIVLIASWVIAVIGFASKVFLAHRVNRVSIASYIALGWIPALAVGPSQLEFPIHLLVLVVVGGVLYTIGTYFLYNDRRHWYFHGIWHTFVLLAAAVHYIAILQLFEPSQ